MKLPRPLQTVVVVSAFAFLVAGTICLGLGLSVAFYIQREIARSDLAQRSDRHQCIAFLTVGVTLCIVGMGLRAVSWKQMN